MITKPILTILLILSVFTGASSAIAATDFSDALQPKAHTWFCAESDTEQKEQGEGKKEEEEPDCD